MQEALQTAQAETLATIDSTEFAADHNAKFCGVWSTVRPGLVLLKDLIPGAGPIIIGSLLLIGDGVARKVGCPVAPAAGN